MSPEQIHQLAERIARSRTFERSEQLKTILLELCTAAAEGRGSEITEAMIGERVLNRKNFDPETDTIVRVQMRRLRTKLEEYYRTEGAADPIRVEIPRYSYVPQLKEAEPSGDVFHSPAAPKHWRPGGFWTGFAAASALAALFAALISLRPRPVILKSPASLEITESPFWRGFFTSHARPTIAVSTPLFFRTSDSYVRDFRLNLPEDLVHARTLLGNRPAWPTWTKFVSLSDAESILLLERLFSRAGLETVVKSAREVTSRDLTDHPVVFLGHPRGSPPLLDLLDELPFGVRRTAAGQPIRGIVNRAPRDGEPAEYLNQGENDLEILSENRPDYVLVSSLRRESGGSVLSIFGNRYDSTYLVVGRLTDAASLSELHRRLPARTDPGWSSRGIQIVFRVSYLNGKPIDLEYLTHRMLSPTNSLAQIR